MITMSRDNFTNEEAKQIGDILGADWSQFDVDQFRLGLDIELEHGTCNPRTNVTNDDSLATAKIAFRHLTEFPDYYTRLQKMEAEAGEHWASRGYKGESC